MPKTITVGKYCAYVKKKTTPRVHKAYIRAVPGRKGQCKHQMKSQSAKRNRPKKHRVSKLSKG